MDFRNNILPHRDRLFRLALSIISDVAEAEDIVQDTMLRAWEQKAEWSNIGNLQAWLQKVCKNIALDHRKKYGRTTSLDQLPTASEPMVHTRTDSDSLNLLSQLISELPSPLDELIRLRDIEGMKRADIAQQLNLSEDQVSVYLHRARARLRARYLQLQNFDKSSSASAH